MSFVHILGHRIEYAWFGGASDARPVVMLHEGLGSVALWKEFPERLAEATGRRVLAYSRYGHGRSDRLSAPRDVRYLHDEALEALPRLLEALSIEAPVLFGHSDGASIALIHAGAGSWPVTAVVALAPHVFVEPVTLESIRQAGVAFGETDLPTKLARHHDDPASTFWGWNRIWLDPRFEAWNIEECLPRIACPVLAIQGLDDEYGTLEQIRRIARRCPQASLLELDACGHSPHRDQAEAVLAATTTFVRTLRGS